MTPVGQHPSEAARDGLRGYLAAFLPPDLAARETSRLLRDLPFAGAPELLAAATRTLVKEHGAPHEVVLDVLVEDLKLPPRVARVVVTHPWGAAPELTDQLPENLFTSHPAAGEPVAVDPIAVSVPHRDPVRSRRWVSARVLVVLAFAVVLVAAIALRPGPPAADVGGVSEATPVEVVDHALAVVAPPDGSRPTQDNDTFGAGPVVLWVRVQVDEASDVEIRWNTPDGRTRTSTVPVEPGTLALTAVLPSSEKTAAGTYGVQVAVGGRLLLTRTFLVVV